MSELETVKEIFQCLLAAKTLKELITADLDLTGFIHKIKFAKLQELKFCVSPTPVTSESSLKNSTFFGVPESFCSPVTSEVSSYAHLTEK